MFPKPSVLLLSFKAIYKKCGYRGFTDFHICCDLDPIFTRISSAEAVIGIYKHTISWKLWMLDRQTENQAEYLNKQKSKNSGLNDTYNVTIQ